MKGAWGAALCVLLAVAAAAQDADVVDIKINTDNVINEIRENFVCFTMDWWPPEKCDYGTCAWGYDSILNKNLNDPLLSNAMAAIAPATLRIGGSLQDNIRYDIGNPPVCEPIRQVPNRVNFTGGCLNMTRWAEVNRWAKSNGIDIVFGLSELNGYTQIYETEWEGQWNGTNAYDLMKFTIGLGDDNAVIGWQLGNEVGGSGGVFARLKPDEVARDFNQLRAYIDELYVDFDQKPLVIGPDALPSDEFWSEFLKIAGDSMNVLAWHEYSLGAGVDPEVNERMTDPFFLDKFSATVAVPERFRAELAPQLELWISEGGGAYNSGRAGVSNTFRNGFWWLDQIETIARQGHQSYCRQTFVGGNYGLVDSDTSEPNPDFYTTLLWRRLMGEGVLDTFVDEKYPYLRAYTHCTKRGNAPGLAVVLLNLHPTDTYHVNIEAGRVSRQRHEYRLTAPDPDGDLLSRRVLLNGVVLETQNNQIPDTPPLVVANDGPVVIDRRSYMFVVFPEVPTVACSS